MSKYRLRGHATVIQYCHVQYPEKTGLSTMTMCHNNDCDGHTIGVYVDEIVEAESPDDAIGNESLSKYEYSKPIYGDHEGLEPSWVNDPKVTEVKS